MNASSKSRPPRWCFYDNQQYVVKNSSRPTAVPVEVVNETENESSIRPWKKDDLRPTDEIAIKGAIFVFGSLKKQHAAQMNAFLHRWIEFAAK